MRLALPSPGYRAVSGWFAAAALACLAVADLHVTTLHPFAELMRLLGGLIRPDFPAVEIASIVYTVAFAVLGVGLGAGTGLLLAIPFARSRAVRLVCAALRSVHELFWALLLMQVFGLSATTGVLAIALPYAGICAKVYSEIIEEADLSALRVLPPGTGASRPSPMPACRTSPGALRTTPSTASNAACAPASSSASSACRRWASPWNPPSARGATPRPGPCSSCSTP